MVASYQVRQACIFDLIMGWAHRDLGEWNSLRKLFHSDGTIEVTWFEGQFSNFVDASMRMGASDLRTKHFIESPTVTYCGDRAVAETNVTIVAENIRLGVGCSEQTRFHDLIEQRNGEWKIVTRRCIYDMGTITFPHGAVAVDTAVIQKYPPEYAALAYVLERSGFPVARVFPTKGSDQEKAIQTSARSWLLRSSSRTAKI